jgi:AcrR family transcriptional regulator
MSVQDIAFAAVTAAGWEKLLEEILSRATRGSERKQDRSRRTEQQIFNAALRVFARDGLSRSKISDIAAEAGISTSTFYEYYKSKEDLAYDVPMFYLADFFESYRAAAPSSMSARERLLLYLTMSADYAREHAEWARLLYLEIWPSVFVSETELQYTINDFAKIVQFLVEIGKVEGWVDPTRNKYDTAAIIIGGSNQLIITWLLYRKPRNLTKAGAEIGERIIRLLECECRAG